MAKTGTVKQSIAIQNGKWYALVIGLTSADNNIDFNEVGSLTIRLGQTEKELTALTSYAKRYLLMQAVVNSDADKFIEIEASSDLVNGSLIINDSNQVAVSVRECSDTNLVTNGGFDGSATGWTLGTGWTYGSNKVTHSGASGVLSQAITAITGNPYVIYFEANFTSSGGTFSPNFGNLTWNPDQVTSEIPFINESIGANHTFSITANPDVSVDNIVIREIIGINLVDNSNWDIGNGWRDSGNVCVFTYYSAAGDIISQEIPAITVGLTYRISFDIDGFFDNGLVKVSFVTGTGKNVTVNTRHASFDLVATTTFLQFELINYLIAGYPDIVSDVTYLSIGNVSLKLNTNGVLGPELVTNGSFTGGLTSWDNVAGEPFIVHGNGYLTYKPWEIGAFPIYSPSIITSVKKVGQNLPFPQYVIAGKGGVNQSDYILFKKSDTQNFTLWRSPVYNIGKDFDVMEIIFNLGIDLDANTEIIPKLYFDNERNSAIGSVINNTNYSNNDKLIVLTSKNFGNQTHGKHNFFLELQFTGTSLAVVSTPINIDIEVNET